MSLTTLKNDIKTMLTEYGQTVTVRNPNITADRVALSGSASNSDTDITAVVSHFDEDQFEGTRIKAGDVKVLCNGDAAIEQNYTLIINSEEYQIVAVRTVKPDGIILGYIVQARR